MRTPALHFRLFASLALSICGVSAAEVIAEVFPLAGAIDYSNAVPPPPAPSSIAGEADLAAVLQAQAWRTPEQVAFAERVAKMDYFALMSEGILPAEFTKENCPELVALFRRIYVTLVPNNEELKKLHDRPRPFVADARVQPCVEKLTSLSYPSGHAQGARMWAEVLSDLYPDYRAQLHDRAQQIGWARVLGGVHYPSDVVAGYRASAVAYAALKKTPAFQEALEKCRAEAGVVLRKKAA